MKNLKLRYMIIIKNNTLFLLVLLFLSACSNESKQQEWENEFKIFKTENITPLTTNFEKLRSYKAILDASFTDTSFLELQKNKINKQIKINIDFNNQNTMLVTKYDLDQLENDNKPLYYNPIFNNMRFIKKIIQNKENDLLFIKKIRENKPDFKNNNQSISIEYNPINEYNDFIKACNVFKDLEYIITNEMISFTAPKYNYSNDTYTLGYCKALIVLYDFKTSEMLDAFVYSAQSNNSINYDKRSKDVISIINKDFNHNITSTITDIVRKRYLIENFNISSQKFIK